MLLSVQCTALAAHWTDSKIVCVSYVVCRVSGVQHVGVVTINHAHLLDRPLLVCLSVCSKTAEGTNFKFGRRVPMTPDKYFRKVGVVTVT